VQLLIEDIVFIFYMIDSLFDLSLWGLFLASFLAATVVPFSSEALLTLLIANGTYVNCAIAVATAGNWLGGMSSFGIGYLGKWEWIEKYLRIKRETIEKWHDRLYRRGAIFAFLSWVPFVGDVFAVGLGLLRANIWVTALAMLIGKFCRYMVWAWLSGLFF
jgi:membrane protein YqaA with SNARE-associated domain